MKQFEMTFLLGAGRILLTLTVPLILTHQKIMVASFGCWSWTSFSSFLEIFSKWVEVLVWEWSLRCGSLKPSSQLCCLYVSQDVFFIPYMIRRSQLYWLTEPCCFFCSVAKFWSELWTGGYNSTPEYDQLSTWTCSTSSSPASEVDGSRREPWERHGESMDKWAEGET
jgi:hypothetical protein